MILFVSGFNRSGTTVLQEAVAAATGGRPLTVGDIMRHCSPELAGRLRRIVEAAEPVDRGVDRRQVTADTPEEYGWLLLDWGSRDMIGRPTSRFTKTAVSALGAVADCIAGSSGIAVLKNPSDTGREALLLGSFPQAGVILSRRRIGGIMASSCAALTRLSANPAYILALSNDSSWIRSMLWLHRTRMGAGLIRAATRWNLRLRLVGFLRRLPNLPLERAAFVDYDELLLDPERAAFWAGHIVDAGRLAKQFRTAHSIPERERLAGGWIDRRLDRRWAAAWERARAEQVRRGILTPR